MHGQDAYIITAICSKAIFSRTCPAELMAFFWIKFMKNTNNCIQAQLGTGVKIEDSGRLVITQTELDGEDISIYISQSNIQKFIELIQSVSSDEGKKE